MSNRQITTEVRIFGSAVAFSVLATISTAVAASIEGRLLTAETGVQPFVSNYSTIVDFAILDPLLIVALGYALKSIRELRLVMLNSAHVVMSLAVGVILTYFYAKFSTCGGGFFDAFITQRGVTLAGWIAFGWTGLILSIVVHAIIAQLRYVFAILSLSSTSVKYDPMHEDNCGGFQRLSLPSWYFLHAALVGLLIFVGFFIQDGFINKAASGFRLACFVVFAVGAPTVFLIPVLRLRAIMRELKAKHFAFIQSQYDKLVKESEVGTAVNPKQLSEGVGELVKLRKQISNFPSWPLPLPQVAQSAAYCVASSIPFVSEVIRQLSSKGGK